MIIEASATDSILAQLGPESWQTYSDMPLPGWSTNTFTLFNMAHAQLANARPVHTAVCSIPFDSTASTRIGARKGGFAIREASLALSAQMASRGAIELQCMRTDKRFCPVELDAVDFGDLHTFPSSPASQVAATAAEIYRVASLCQRAIILGGEHTLSYPCFYGIAKYCREHKGLQLGYVHIDHHFDFGRIATLHGPYYHGSNGRRISEIPWVEAHHMAFLGQGDFTSRQQYDELLARGVHISNIAAIRKRGLEGELRAAIEALLGPCDALYVSIDIDVCDMSVAPGTGHFTIGGISAAEFIDVVRILRDYPVRALDIMEVSPALDPTERTAGLASRALFEYLLMQEVTTD